MFLSSRVMSTVLKFFQIKFSILNITEFCQVGIILGSYPLRMDYRTKPHISNNSGLNVPIYITDIFHFEVYFFQTYS